MFFSSVLVGITPAVNNNRNIAHISFKTHRITKVFKGRFQFGIRTTTGIQSLFYRSE
ncbi:Uncharacterised protein [Escherichia coli]|nr:Uncharacterised protein [Escherichia coli]